MLSSSSFGMDNKQAEAALLRAELARANQLIRSNQVSQAALDRYVAC
jgi:hypothetical protein